MTLCRRSSSQGFHPSLNIVSGAVVFVTKDTSVRTFALLRVSRFKSFLSIFSAALFTGVFHPIRGLERACKVVVAVPALDVRAQLESKFHHWKVCYRRLDFIIFSYIFT